MRCPKCGAEHSAKYCPQCGAPASPQPELEDKPKKSIFKRWWFWLLAVLLLILILPVLSNNNGDNGGGGAPLSPSPRITGKPADVTATPEASAPEPTPDLSQVETTFVLAGGYYTAGIDIPSGKCNVTAAKGQGNLSSSNLYSGGVNEMFGVDDGSGLYTESFNGLKLPEGVTLSVSGGLSVRLVYTVVEGGFTGRTYDEENAITLGSGNYTAGTDFEPGTYKITAISGSGNLYSSNIFQGGVNEVFGVDDGSGWYTPEIFNIELAEGTELSVSGGLSVRLARANE